MILFGDLMVNLVVERVCVGCGIWVFGGGEYCVLYDWWYMAMGGVVLT